MSTRSIHLPPPTLEAERLARSDRLSLFIEVCAEHRHLTSLIRDFAAGKADLETTIPILDRSAQRLARATRLLATEG